MAEPGKGAHPDTYTLSSGEAAKAELRELREVAEEMAQALRHLSYDDDGDDVWAFPSRASREAILARHEALRDG